MDPDLYSPTIQSLSPDDAIVCLSHVRWGYALDRAQRLMTRFAAERRVYFIEEPIAHDGPLMLEVTYEDSGVRVVTPRVPRGLGVLRAIDMQRRAIDHLLHEERVDRYALWYLNAMALPFTRHLEPSLIVYDRTDPLGDFAVATPELVAMESSLLERADIVYAEAQPEPEPIECCLSGEFEIPSRALAQAFLKALSQERVFRAATPVHRAA